jgi:serine/threonine protein kinase
MEYSKKANLEPISGYRLIEPLGQGGFGEVWKCVAPGGIFKAIKFVFGNLNVQDANRANAQQEFNALQRVKGINHPYVLSMDRIEVINGELVIVMELADRSLFELMASYRQEGQPGVPREELLEYLCEASEALDLMNLKYGLQHLDIKPGNLFLVSNHVKVADFGLVNDMVGVGPNAAAATAQLAGITPLYASPEAFMGRISRYSDQYSLAIVYQELLTGTLPFDGKNARQLAMQHAMAPPNLHGLPETDRPIVGKALAKDPLERYPSCLTFMLALITNQVQPTSAASPDKLTAARVIRSLRGGSAGSQPEIMLPSTPMTGAEQPVRGASDIAAPMAAKPAQGLSAMSMPRPAAADAAASAHDGAAAGAPGGDGLPAGYKFLRDLGRSPMGDLWLVSAPNGARRLVKAILDFTSKNPAAEAKAIAQLKRLRHPALARLDFIEIEQGRLLVGMELIEHTLAKRYESLREGGLMGIPRDELLVHLRQVAVALDELYDQTSIQHLALNPKCVLLTDEAVLISDFGILHLLGDSMGQPVANLNPRYSAPELAENRPSRSSDQFSLAVMYQEMLTGTRPFREQRLRIAAGGRGSLGRRRAAEGPPPELDALPPDDRDIVARALERDPQRRFETCTEFIDALEGGQLIEESVEYDLPGLQQASDLPPEQPATKTEFEIAAGNPVVTPHAVKLPTSPTMADPSAIIGEIVRLAAGDWEVFDMGGMRCLYRPGETLLHRCGASSYASGMAKGKLEGFGYEWNAELVRNQEDSVTYQIQLPTGGFTFWGKKPLLEVDVKLLRPRVQAAILTEVQVTFRPINCKAEQANTALTRVASPLLESIRRYLAVSAERRGALRLTYDQPLYLSPVFGDRSTDKPIQSQGKDISRGGLGCYTPVDLRAGQKVLAHLNSPRADAGPVNIPGLIIRSQACGNGWFEVGVKIGSEGNK